MLMGRNLLHIITQSDWGGAQRVVDMLARRTNPNVAVACGSGGKLVNKLRADDIPVFVCSNLKRSPHPYYDIRAVGELVSILREESFDIVHCHSTKAGIVGRLAARIVGIPVVFTVHGWGFYNTEFSWFSPVIRNAEKVMACMTDQIICVSQNDLSQGQQYNITQKTNSTVIHNGIPPLSFSKNRVSLSDLCDLPSDSVVLGSISRLVPQKNPFELLHTAKFLEKKGYNADVVHIGSGPLEAKCHKYIDQKEIDNIHMLGFVEKALDLLPDIDVFLLPSSFEGFPLTVLESMHSGTPIVAYDVGGVAEAIVDGQTGYVVPYDERDQFIEKITYLIEHPEIREQMGSQAETVARSKFTAARMANDYDAIYDRVLRDN